MAIVSPYIAMPVPADTGGKTMASHQLLVATSGEDAHTLGIVPGSFVAPDTNGYASITASTATVYGRVVSILDSNMRALAYQAVTADQLNATGAVFYLTIEPVGGVIYHASEDALTTPITDANSTVYADLAFTDFTSQASVNPIGTPIQKILIDSNTVNASSSNLQIQLLGLAPVANQNPYSATASASPRVFRFKFVTAGLSL